MTTVTETFVFPNSSNLEEATYDPSVENLTIVFNDGAIYVYYNVPNAVYRGLCAAGSAGKYFHRSIKNRYAYDQQ